MDTLMLRCSMSPVIRDQQDEFNVITNKEGKMLVGRFGNFIGQFLASWKGSIAEGDVFVTNDVYEIDRAVTHLNDVIVPLPIHYKGEIVGWAANWAHVIKCLYCLRLFSTLRIILTLPIAMSEVRYQEV